MPEYNAPGVFIEESSRRPHGIEGVPTDVAAIAGPTARVPPGPPPPLESFAAFADAYGDAGDLTALAVRAFFENDGRKLYVASSARGYVNALEVLEEIDDVAVVLTPGAAALGRREHAEVIAAVTAHCEKMRYRFGIADSREGQGPGEVRRWAAEVGDKRLALYYPWVRADLDGNGERLLPPSGFLAGVYARVDRERGVFKAPANETVKGAVGFERELGKREQDILNPVGVSCLRSFSGRGHQVWGARTACFDPDCKYISARRYFDYAEHSIERGTQWVVFEPNGEVLWAKVRSLIEQFLQGEWHAGAFPGAKPEECWFVRCDRTTMTQIDLDNGRLVCQVGIALLEPAEFVVFRISQKTADA